MSVARGKQRKAPVRVARSKKPASQETDSFPIVGVGASAGGLEALELFLGAVPEGCGMAFVVVQHLDPTRKGIMAELLQRVTGMSVVQVKDRTKVRPGCVYVIPPNKDMSILHGVLHLLAPAAPRGLRLPIDFFLRSLAQDRQEHSIGVVLSGMGSDGTLGLRALKEVAGVALVQDPTSAKFDGMPRSAIGAGLADIVAPAAELPGRIIAYLQRAPLIPTSEAAMQDRSQSTLEKAIILLRAHTGHDFTLYKRNTLYRRIERRMGLHQIARMATYVRYLQENPQELDLLFKELLIGVTRFFRDPSSWELLSEKVLPALLASRTPGQALRAWVPGCSTGEEAYSLAIVLQEAVQALETKQRFAIQVFGTDLDRDAIGKARHGFFPENIASDVSPERLARFFVKEDFGYRLIKEIRETVIFAPQDLIMDPPFTKLDILTCRNLLIYLNSEVQRKLIPLFHYSLRPGGVLFLGSAETVGGASELFVSLNARCRLYQRTESFSRTAPVEFPSSFHAGPPAGAEAPPPPASTASLQSAADQLVLQRYAPPTALANDKGDILYISGRTGKYLEPAAGKANWNIFAMAREGLRYELANAFQKAIRQKESVTVCGLTVAQPEGEKEKEQCVDVCVQRLDDPGPLQGLVMIAFTDAVAPEANQTVRRKRGEKAHGARAMELEKEIQQVRHEARSTHEEMQTVQEELQSANEELQSTNEELTTSKEEMQSLNEELQTVNAELQSKVDDLSRASNDMKNLLDSTEIATLFLDKELNVRRFTPPATKIIKLIPGDIGRPITDLASDLRYPALAEDARQVLQSLAFSEKQIGTQGRRWYTVRIMPYRTVDDRIDGVVITFADITAAKTLEATLRDKNTVLENRSSEKVGKGVRAGKGAQT